MQNNLTGTENTTWEYGMDFESCMRRVFGDDAVQIASGCLDDSFRQMWVKKLLKQLIRDAQDIDSHQKHREHISAMLEILLKRGWTGNKASWSIVFKLLSIIADLLGYAGARGTRAFTPMYCQSLQTHLDIGNATGKADELLEEFASAARNRAEVVKYLKEKGLTDFDVAMALKTTEYEVKKLKRST